MTDLPDPDALPDDSWMPDGPAVAPKPAPKAKPKAKVTPLRPIDALAAELDEAAASGAPPLPPEDPPPPPEAMGPAEPGGPPSRSRPYGAIWDGCPVTPMGVNGATYWYLDVHGQLRGVTKHDAQNIMMLFGRQIPKLCHQFPKWEGKEGDRYRKPGHFEHQAATVAMISACSERGLFDPEGAVRGVGAWTDDDGQLIYHTGDYLWVGEDRREPGSHDRRIYPAMPAIPHPAETVKDAAAMTNHLIAALQTWSWERPDLDPFIALGLIGVQAMGGALSWRPAYWITGAAGAGKSALQKLILHLHGGEKGLIQSTDATARGIASLLGQSTLPVALDELEPGDAGSTKERDIIQTARVAASGGRWARGSSDQKGSTGQLRSTFLFSSILIPGVLKSQDLQRIIVLNLTPLPEGAVPPDMRAETWRKRGAAIKRLILDRWPTWAARLDLWRESLAAHGVAGRDADNWGTTLAMAQMIQAEEMPQPDAMDGWCGKIAKAIRGSRSESGSDADEVLMHLMTQRIDVFRKGQMYTVAQWLMVAAAAPDAPAGLLDGYAIETEAGREQRAKAANALLAPYMLRIVREAGQEPRLFVGNAKAQPILDLFRDTQWAGGAWSQSLERVKGAQRSSVARTLAGVASRGIEIPLSAMPSIAAFPVTRSSGTVHPMAADFQAEDFA